MDLLFENLVKSNKEAFKLKVIDISNKLGANPNWLMWVMRSESGLNAQAQNTKYLVQGQPATGLIQFVKSTAEYLGTSIPALYNMSNVDQLDYVYKYFKPYAGRIKSIYDVYLIIFFPIALGKPDSWEFQTKNLKPQTVAKSNPIFDLNKDGIITVAEFKKYIDKKITPEQRPFIFTSTGSAMVGIVFLLGMGLLLRQVLK